MIGAGLRSYSDTAGPYHIVRVALSQSPSRKERPRVLSKLGKMPNAIFMSPRNTYLIALAAATMYVYRLPIGSGMETDWDAPYIRFSSDYPLTCGAFAPLSTTRNTAEETFATGDSRGVIKLWHGLADAFRQMDARAAHASMDVAESYRIESDKQLPSTRLHWHAHAVASLAFTPSGSQLLSVGEESVLVQWQLANGSREFVPRLGGRAIWTVAVKPASRGHEEEWWMGFADGSMKRVGAASGHIMGTGDQLRLGQSVLPLSRG